MKSLLILILAVPAFGIELEDKPGLEVLAKRVAAAIKENDPAKYKACWQSIEQIRDIVPHEVDNNRAFFEKREKLVQASFPLLRKAMVDAGFDADSAELESCKGKFYFIRGLLMTLETDLVVKDKNGTQILLGLGKCITHKDGWGVGDDPIPGGFLVKGGVKHLFKIDLEAIKL